MDLNLFAREMLSAESVNKAAVLAALDGDKDAIIRALWRGSSADAGTANREAIIEDREGLIKERNALRTALHSANEEHCALARFRDGVYMIMGATKADSPEAVVEEVRGLSDSYDMVDRERDALIHFRDRIAAIGTKQVRDKADQARISEFFVTKFFGRSGNTGAAPAPSTTVVQIWPKDDLDALAKEVENLSKAFATTETALRAATNDRLEFRHGIINLLGDFLSVDQLNEFGDSAKYLVHQLQYYNCDVLGNTSLLKGDLEKAEAENAALQDTYTTFHREIVNALDGGVATEEQILQAVRDLAAKPTTAPDPRVAALQAEVEALKEQISVQAIMAAQRETPIANRLYDEIASLRTILFAHETREMLLQADLRRAQDALKAAGQPLPQEASANSRVPAIPTESKSGFSRSATTVDIDSLGC